MALYGRSSRLVATNSARRRYTCEGEQPRSASRKRQMTTPIEIGRFVGAPVRAHTFDGVSIAENTYASGLSVAAHTHDAPLLSLVLQGHATEEIGGHSRELKSQSLLYTPAFESHGHRFLTAGRWLNIQFSARWIARVGAGVRMLPTAAQLVRGGTTVNWASRLGAEIREPDTVSQFAIEGALLLLISDLARMPVLGERRRPRWLKVIEDAIEAFDCGTACGHGPRGARGRARLSRVAHLQAVSWMHGRHLRASPSPRAGAGRHRQLEPSALDDRASGRLRGPVAFSRVPFERRSVRRRGNTRARSAAEKFRCGLFQNAGCVQDQVAWPSQIPRVTA